MMPLLTAACSFELKDKRVLDIIKVHEDVDIFRSIHGVVSESWLLDRTENVQLPFKSKILKENKIPNAITGFKKNLTEICVDRALELHASCDNEIYILWSGGIDSTLIVVGFLLANLDLDKITIVCNHDSVKENTLFYRQHILKKFKIISSEAFTQRMKIEIIDGLIISGEQGDLIFGQDFGQIMFQRYGADYLKLTANRSTITKFFTDSDMTSRAANCWYDIFMGSAHLSPRPIDTVYDFSWWTGFNWRWQWALEKIKMRSVHDQNIKTFFSGDAFQQWAFGHNQDINEITDFKLDYKKIICNYTKDFNYLEKIKIPSATFYYGANAFAALTETGKRIKSKEFSIMNSYQADNFISQWIKNS